MDFTYHTVEELILEESFQRWALGCNKTDIQVWEEWIALHPEKKQIVEEAYYILQAFTPDEIKIKPSQIDNDYEKISHFYDELTPAEDSQQKTFRIGKLAKIAASLLIILFGGFAAYFYLTDFNSRSEFITSTQEQKEISLPDGSHVILNENTRLTFNKNWENERLRRVSLEGEAYFSVSETIIDEEPIKFIVETGDVQVEVIGTEFNISKNADNTTVVLNSGKIRLEAKHKTIAMIPGDIVQYFPKNDRLIKKASSPEGHTTWVKEYKDTKSTKQHFSRGDNSSTGSTLNKEDKNNTEAKGTKAHVTLKNENPKNYAQNNQSNSNQNQTRANKLISITKETPTGAKGSILTGGGNQYYYLPENHKGRENKNNLSIVHQEGNYNQAYIEQIGSGLSSEQVQRGNHNSAESEFSGNNIQDKNDDYEWSTRQEQIGDKNISIFQIMESYNSNVYSTQEGLENRINAQVEGEENLLFMLQDGGYNIITARQQGINNKAGYSPLDPGILQQGQYNEADIIQHGEHNELNITQQGNNNKANINQQNK
ncbi:MAG: FecR domain-containing protein [Bacteroidales bacterium]